MMYLKNKRTLRSLSLLFYDYFKLFYRQCYCCINWPFHIALLITGCRFHTASMMFGILSQAKFGCKTVYSSLRTSQRVVFTLPSIIFWCMYQRKSLGVDSETNVREHVPQTSTALPVGGLVWLLTNKVAVELKLSVCIEFLHLVYSIAKAHISLMTKPGCWVNAHFNKYIHSIRFKVLSSFELLPVHQVTLNILRNYR